ncbi:hypothetical protein HA402_011405 [Bradysia odoriphaga]|nr:hypothetical protein HA402_011405 [Bradysia odoriphaga]
MRRSVFVTMLKSEQSKVFFLMVLFVASQRISSATLCDRYLRDEFRIDGKVMIVTGGTSGLGLETARNLAGRGGRIYIASRDEKKGNDSVKDIRKTTGNQDVHFIKVDLASLKSIQRFSEIFHAKENRLDVLINNAGIGTGTYQKTEDGFEMDIAVNHLGPFLLTNLLLDLLKASAPSRILVVTSIGYLFGDIPRTNLISERFYPGFLFTYLNSKLANVLFARELSKRLLKTGVTANSVDPGFSMSAFARHLPYGYRIIAETIQQLFADRPEDACKTHVMVAVDPSLSTVTGKHFEDCVEEPLATSASKNDTTSRWLWEASAKLTKLDQYLMKQSTVRKQ